MESEPMNPQRDVWFLGTLMHFHATTEDTAGSCSVVEQLAPAGFAPPLHVHDQQDAFVYVLSGQLTVTVGERTTVVGAGQGAVLPRGVPHTFRADQSTRLLEVTTPAGSDRFYRELGEPAVERTLPPAGPLPDFVHLQEVSARHGARILSG